MTTPVLVTQVVSITAALLGAGANAGLTFFDIPVLKSQPASRSLPAIRWLFSRGSHTIPQAAGIAGLGFGYLAYNALPSTHRSLIQLLKVAVNSSKVNAYIAASLLAFSLGPFTQVMIPTNFALIKMNEELGGFRSAESARQNADSSKAGGRSALDSVNSMGEAPEFTDLSGPQGKTARDSTPEEDRKVKELLTKFNQLNLVRIGCLAASGVVGLVTALM